jgi:hypothetical protein
MVLQDFSINENKINQLLDEINNDRNKIFNEIKILNSTDKVKEDKIKALEYIQRALFTYKKILIKEKEKKENE